MRTFKHLTSRYGTFPRNYLSSEIRWNHWDLLHIHSGQIEIIIENKNIRMQKGSSVLVRPGIKFKISNGSSITTASVQYFTISENSEIHKSLKKIKSYMVHANDFNKEIESHIEELNNKYMNDTPLKRTQELLLELIIEKFISDQNDITHSSHPWGQLANKYTSLMEQSPSIEEVAQWAGYSPSRFRVIFQEDTGMQPKRYFIKLKMDRASQELIETLTPIKEISHNLGYSEVAHFNRAFVKYFGISPGKYRRRNSFQG